MTRKQVCIHLYTQKIVYTQKAIQACELGKHKTACIQKRFFVAMEEAVGKMPLELGFWHAKSALGSCLQLRPYPAMSFFARQGDPQRLNEPPFPSNHKKQSHPPWQKSLQGGPKKQHKRHLCRERQDCM